MNSPERSLLPPLGAYVAEVLGEFEGIPEARRRTLGSLAQFVADRSRNGQLAELTFICTHNSRRSQMAQIWAQTAACRFSVDGVATYSGGTEATSFNHRAVAAIRRAGFAVEEIGAGANPVYGVRFLENMQAVRCFSKVYDHPPNPTKGFAAVMTCSAADAACPIVSGASTRIAIPFDDPKVFDGTDRESTKYDERCRQIAREMLYAFSQVGVS